jgi:hypothetical protein
MANVEEREAGYVSGWLALAVWLGAMAWALWSVGMAFYHQRAAVPLTAILAIPLLVFLGRGFVVLEPNLAAVLTFFGRYAGTIRSDGFFWYTPF